MLSTPSGAGPVLAGRGAAGFAIHAAHTALRCKCDTTAVALSKLREHALHVAAIPTPGAPIRNVRSTAVPGIPGPSRRMILGGLAEPDLAGNDGLSHIIWKHQVPLERQLDANDEAPCASRNILLCDKTAQLTQATIAENRVTHILAILPDALAMPALIAALGVPTTVLEYGTTHEPTLTAGQRAAFDAAGALIDAQAQGTTRGSVLVFCNSGYQRSIPFLSYYLTTRHPKEAPTVARAVDLILPQVDREGYSASRAGWITSVEQLLSQA